MRRPLQPSGNAYGVSIRLGRRLTWSLGGICTVVVWVWLCYASGKALQTAPLLASEGIEPLAPIPLMLDLAPAKVALGE